MVVMFLMLVGCTGVRPAILLGSLLNAVEETCTEPGLRFSAANWPAYWQYNPLRMDHRMGG